MIMNETQTFSGKVAFITGAANGIGGATALAFARQGAGVVVADVSAERNETVRPIEKAGGRAIAVNCDASKADDAKAALNKTVEASGRADCAVNNPRMAQKKLA